MRSWIFGAVLLCAAQAVAAERTALFAGGCFWSMEAAFDDVPGVTKAVSGYAGGTVVGPTYEQVSGGDTGHLEAVQVTYDDTKTDYVKLLDVFWHHVDPFDATGQFCDHGPEYRSAIFALDETQKAAAEKSRQDVERRLGKKVVTEMRPSAVFYPAEEYHQHFTKKNPTRYGMYKMSCGRAERIADIWRDAKP